MQCAILSSGRVDNQYVLTEEPDVSDKLIANLRQMSCAAPEAEARGASVAQRRAGDHWHLPFELRMLETALDEACSLMGVEVRGVVTSATSRMAILHASVVRPSPVKTPSVDIMPATAAAHASTHQLRCRVCHLSAAARHAACARTVARCPAGAARRFGVQAL